MLPADQRMELAMRHKGLPASSGFAAWTPAARAQDDIEQDRRGSLDQESLRPSAILLLGGRLEGYLRRLGSGPALLDGCDHAGTVAGVEEEALLDAAQGRYLDAFFIAGRDA